MDALLQDLRFAVRSLRKSPGLTLAAGACLALGIGATTTVFSIADRLLLHPLPARHDERLVMLGELPPDRNLFATSVSPATFADWERHATSFERLAAYSGLGANITGTAEPERVRGFRVTAHFFDLLDATLALGRTFTADEMRAGGPAVVVLSYPLWRRRFGGDPGTVGRSVLINGAPYTVVGVMGERFIFPAGSELWVPLALAPSAAARRQSRSVEAFARLKPGVSVTRARAEMDGFTRELARQYPDAYDGWSSLVEPMARFQTRMARPFVLVIVASVGLVLLIVCANVANLLLVRGMAREREIAVRAALGASRPRIVRQLLTESAVLALTGGALGALLALWGVRLFRTALPPELVKFNPGWTSIVVDARVLAFTLAASLATGLVFGVVPALQSSRPRLLSSLKEGGRGATGGRAQRRMRAALVAAELALALMLLVSTGLMLRSFVYLLRADPGFRVERTLTMILTLPSPRYDTLDTRVRLYTTLLERVRALPAVHDAALVSSVPMDYDDWRDGVALEGRPPARPGSLPQARIRVVSADFFRTLGIPLLRGRAFSEHDDRAAPPVAVVSRMAAAQFWPGESPIGRRLGVDGDSTRYEVVGIAGDVRHNPNSGVDPVRPTVYLALRQSVSRSMGLLVRTAVQPTSVAAAVQREIGALDRALAAGAVMPLEQVASNALAPQRMTAGMAGVFAAIALVLAVVGVYGVMAYTVTQRTHEIGIRMALGAQRGDVARLIVGRGLALALVGVGLGLVGALAMSRGLARLLHGVSPTDPLTFGGVTLALGAAALLASYLPARRAARVDPMVALRAD